MKTLLPPVTCGYAHARTLLERALNAASDLNCATYVSDANTLSNLEELQSQVEGHIEALKEYMSRSEEKG
jgi:hypothetical protein